MATRYWINQAGGTWSATGNWQAGLPPAPGDDANITGPIDPATQIITGPGAAAGMAFIGNTTLEGAFTAARVSIGDAVNAATLALDAAATLSISGALTLSGSAYGTDMLTIDAGAAVQAGSVVLTPGGSNSITVDATSTMEAGALGGVAQGTFAIDAGATVSGAGLISAVNGITDQGTITAQGGDLVIAAPVTGAGQVQIDSAATLTLSAGRAASTAAIAFSGVGGTLSFGSYIAGSGGVFTTGFDPQGVISGFAAGDTLSYAGADASSLVYAPGTGGTGTLTIGSATGTLGVLTLAGSFAGETFLLAPTGGLGFNIVLVPVIAGGGGTAAAGTAAADSFTWLATAGGNWGNAANWAGTAGVAPGVNDLVTITGDAGTQYTLINGPGNAASLALLGNTDLAGTFTIGAVTAGSATASASVILGTGTSLAATTAVIDHALLQDNGGTLIVGGQATLGDATGGSVPTELIAVGGATVQLGGLSLMGAADTVQVDALSTLEVGSAGGAATGTLTIDAGATLSGSAISITAANGIRNNGTIIAQGSSLTVGSLSGTGTMQIGTGATLVVGGTSTEAITFAGAAGTLSLATQYTAQGLALNQTGTVGGFVAGDTISVQGAVLTAAAYQPTGNGVGTLTLFDGTSAVGTLTVLGQYGGSVFSVADTAQGASISVTAPDPMFDVAYYLAQNPDVAAAGVDPYTHYMTTGWKEGRNPNPYFDTRYYLAQNPDVAAAGVNPLTHFEQHGWMEGRQPSLVFSDSGYLAQYPDVAAAGIDPLQHYIQHGQFEGRSVSLTGFDGNLAAANPMVKAATIDAQLGATLLPTGAAAQAQAAEIYTATGWKQGLNPNAWFDTKYYLQQNPDVAASGMDPLLHFEQFGWKEGRQPSLVFDDAKYLAQYPDVAAAGVDPLQHYIDYGQSEGRMTFLTGGTLPADLLVNASYYDAQLGATIIPTGTAAAQQAASSYDTTGWLHNLNPDAFFNTTYYLSHNPDVAAAHIDPLLHYETFGWKEGRNPSALFSTDKYLAAYSDVKAAGMDPLLHYVQFGQAEGRQAFAV